MKAERSSLKDRKRKLVQDAVMDAAATLLESSDEGDFSMRTLAETAGVGFTTPFNHFGSKNAVLRAMAERLLETIAAQFSASDLPDDAYDRVQLMNETGVRLLLERPKIYRTVIGALNVPHPDGPDMRRGAQHLWRLALGDLHGIEPKLRDAAEEVLPDQLAISFRGVITLWISGELENERVLPIAHAAASTLFLGFLPSKRQPEIVDKVRNDLTSVDFRYRDISF